MPFEAAYLLLAQRVSRELYHVYAELRSAGYVALALEPDPHPHPHPDSHLEPQPGLPSVAAATTSSELSPSLVVYSSQSYTKRNPGTPLFHVVLAR